MAANMIFSSSRIAAVYSHPRFVALEMPGIKA